MRVLHHLARAHGLGELPVQRGALALVRVARRERLAAERRLLLQQVRALARVGQLHAQRHLAHVKGARQLQLLLGDDALAVRHLRGQARYGVSELGLLARDLSMQRGHGCLGLGEQRLGGLLFDLGRHCAGGGGAGGAGMTTKTSADFQMPFFLQSFSV